MKEKVENELQIKAFELYYELGNDRSLKAVAKHFGKNERTVANWSRDFKWVERCAKRTAEEAEILKEDAQADVKGKYKRLFNNLVTQAIKDFNSGKLKIRNILDLERVARLHLALLDIPGEVISNDISMNDDDRKLVDNLLNEMKTGLEAIKKQ